MLGDMNETIDLPIPELVQPKIWRKTKILAGKNTSTHLHLVLLR
jgi:hypothetical protein